MMIADCLSKLLLRGFCQLPAPLADLLQRGMTDGLGSIAPAFGGRTAYGRFWRHSGSGLDGVNAAT